MKPEIKEGNVVFSKKGRDKGYPFVVLLSLDDDFVLICDGDRRKVDKPKRKRRKHLSATPHEAPEILSLYAMNRLKDSDVRSALYPIMQNQGAHAPETDREG